MKQKLLSRFKLRALMLVTLLCAGFTSAWADEVTDVIDATATNPSLSTTGATAWKEFELTGTSGAVYKIRSMGTKNAESYAVRWNSNGYLYTTNSGGTLVSITVNGTSGKSVKIFGANSAYSAAASGTSLSTLSLTGSNATYTLQDTYTHLGINGTASSTQITSITVVWETGSTSINPSITSDNVDIAYDATSGSIAYTLANEVTGGSLSAEVTAGNWLTLGTGTTSPISFTCSANTAAAERTATVTLTYTYGTENVTKNVTVTQAGNPNIVDNISDITAAGTYTVQGTIVAKSTRGFIVGDGTGYVYYYNQSYDQSAYNIGDKVKLSGSVVTYGGVFEFNNSTTVTAATESNYVTENPTVLAGGDMDSRVASTSPAQLSTYVQYQGTLTVNDTHYNITSIDGATTAQGSISYPISTDWSSLNGKTVTVKGYYVGVSSSKYYNTMIGSIEEVSNGKKDNIITVKGTVMGPGRTTTGNVFDVDRTATNPVEESLCFISTCSASTSVDYITYTIDANNTTIPAAEYELDGRVLTFKSDRAGKIVLKANAAGNDEYNDADEVTITVNITGVDRDGYITVSNSSITMNSGDTESSTVVALLSLNNAVDLNEDHIKFYAADGTTAATYDWIDAELIEESAQNKVYIVTTANTSTVARTAYLKVYVYDGDYDVYSPLITVTQKGVVSGNAIVDEITLTTTGVTGNSYTEWLGVTVTSDAVYAGQSAGGNDAIQLRSNNNNSGIVTTTSGGLVQKVEVAWNSNTAADRTINIYGSNTAYSAATDLYSSSNQGTLLGTIVCGTSTTLEVTGDYEYIGIRSDDKALYLDKISITWSTNTQVPKPTFSLEEGAYYGAQQVTLSAAAANTLIYYTTDGTEPTNQSTRYTGALTIDATTTIKAVAYDQTDGTYSAVASATYTIRATDAKGSAANPYTVAEARLVEPIEKVYVKGIVSQVESPYDTDGYATYYISDDGTTTGQFQIYRGWNLNQTGFYSGDHLYVGDEVVVYGNIILYSGTNELDRGNYLYSLKGKARIALTTPNAEVSGAAQESSLRGIDFKNFDAAINLNDVTVKFYEADGTTETTYAWITSAEVGDSAPSYDLNFEVTENTGDDRTAYLKIFAPNGSETVVSDLITITQKKAVDMSAITLPFAYNSGKADIANTDGLQQEGLGTDYNSTNAPNTQLKFDGSGDELVMHFNTVPAYITYSIKGNSFSGGSFEVFYSPDGVNYYVYEVITALGDEESKIITNLDANVRFIKWKYYNKSSGNVGLGNIRAKAAFDYTRTATVGNYGTICLPYDGVIEGAELYSIEGVDDRTAPTALSLKAEETLTAGVPYIFKAKETNIRVAYTDDTEAPEAGKVNGLIGSFEQKNITDDAGVAVTGGENPYVLKNNKVCKAGVNVKVGANKAYINLNDVPTSTGSSPVKMFIDADADGIDMVQGSMDNAEFYDLAGRRVIQPRRGIYIVNGKKVLVK